MRILPTQLGRKLNLSLLVFMLVLGAAMAGLIVFGFRRTQHTATDRSREGLEEQARTELLGVSDIEAGVGQFIVGQAVLAGRHASSYMVDFKNQGGSVPWDSSRLAPAATGGLADPAPQRHTDVWVPPALPLDASVDRDLRESAALDSLFPTLLAQEPNAVAIYYVAADGVTRHFPANTLDKKITPGFDPFAVAGFEQFRAGDAPPRTTAWTAAYNDPGGRGLLVSALTPVYDGDEYRGVIAVDLSLASLIAQADSINITQTGYAFVIGRNGDVLPSQASSLVQAAIDDSSNTSFAHTIAAMRAGETGVDRAQLDGREVFVGYAPLGDFGGSLAVVAPIDEVTEQSAAVTSSIQDEARRTVLASLIVMGALFVVALAAAAWLNRRALLAPIDSLVAGTQAIAAGDLDARIPVRSSDEFGMLADSFNRMSMQLGDRNKALHAEAEKRERTAAALFEREQQYRGVFDATSDGLVVTNFDGQVVEANAAACAMHGYTHDEFLQLRALDYVHPDYHSIRREYVEHLKGGEEYRVRARDVRKDGSSFPVEVLGKSFAYRGEPHILGVIRDISEQVQAEQLLEQRVEDRTREITALLEVSRNVASTLDFRQLVNIILDQLRLVVDYTGAALLTLEGDEMVILDSRGPLRDHAENRAAGMRFLVASQPDLLGAIVRGETVIIPNVRADTVTGRQYRDAIGPALESPAFKHVRGWLGVPLVRHDHVVGMLTMSSDEPDYFTEHHAGLALAVAAHATSAIENARLFEQTEERTRELATLLDVSRNVASTLDLPQLLHLILEQARVVAEYDRAAFMLVEGDELAVVSVLDDSITSKEHMDALLRVRYPIATAILWNRMGKGEPAIIPDVRGDTPEADEFRRAVGDQFESTFQRVRTWMGVPVILNDRVIGVLALSSNRPNAYTDRHAQLAMVIMNQAAVAIENARLFGQTEERTRELSTLLDVSRNVASTLALQPLLRLTLEQINVVAEFDRAALMLLDGDELQIVSVLNTHDPHDAEIDKQIGMSFPLSQVFLWDRIAAGDALIIEDVRGDSFEAREYRKIIAGQIETTFEEISTWMGVPIALKERVLGMIAVSREQPNPFTPRHAELAKAIANQAAVAVENARLFQETEEGRREMTALLGVSHAVASTLDLRSLVGVVLDELHAVIDYTGSAILTLEDGLLTIMDARAMKGAQDEIGLAISIERGGAIWDRIGRGEHVLIDDIRDESDLAAAYREVIGGWGNIEAFSSVRSWLGVPLAIGDRVIGMLTVSRTEPGYLTEQHARLARAVGDQAAVAIENARLFSETQRRARETEALLRADAQLFSSLSVNAVFQALVDVTVDVMKVDQGIVTTYDDAREQAVVRASRNVSAAALDSMHTLLSSRRVRADPDGTDAVIFEDVTQADDGFREIFEAEGLRSVLAMPIRSNRGVNGEFGVAYRTDHVFSLEEQRVFRALAERAAVAIDNADLYERAQQVASLEERQRLARELHDSVSQALYGIALGARTARTLLDRNPASAAEPIDYVLTLAEAGLTEMRALIFELRPESLEMEGLVVALEKQVAATRARYSIDVRATLCDEPDAPLDTKEAIYRIAQEALHNTVKHARATQIDLTLNCTNGSIRLDITDNGSGFDPSGDFPGHLGLRSMRERTERLGGKLEITSESTGTHVGATVPYTTMRASVL